MSFKEQCIYWHNYFRTLHQVNLHCQVLSSCHIREGVVQGGAYDFQNSFFLSKVYLNELPYLSRKIGYLCRD